MVLLRTYSCTITDSISVLSIIPVSVLHVRLLSDCFFFSFFVFCVLFVVYFLCTSADLANKRVHNSAMF